MQLGVCDGHAPEFIAAAGVPIPWCRVFMQQQVWSTTAFATTIAANARGQKIILSNKLPVGATYNTVTAGTFDSYFTNIFAGLVTAGIENGIYVFQHEPENDAGIVAADWNAAQVHIASLLHAHALSTAHGWRFGTCLMNWTANPASGRTLSDWYVSTADILLWDPYNDGGPGGTLVSDGPPLVPYCSNDPSTTTVASILGFVQAYMLTKPQAWGLAEFGCARQSADTAGAKRTLWLQAVVASGVLSSCEMACWFELGIADNFPERRLTAEPASLAAFASLGTTGPPPPPPAIVASPMHIPLPNAYHFPPQGREWGGPLRLWNPAWMSVFNGPTPPTTAEADGQGDYIELTAAVLGSYPAGSVLTALQNRPGVGAFNQGQPISKGLFYNIGGVEWVVNPDVNDPHFTPDMFMYGTTNNADPGNGLRNNAAFQTGGGSYIMRLEFEKYWNQLKAYYTSNTAGPGSAAFGSTGFANGILMDVFGIYPTTNYSNTNGTPSDPWNNDSYTLAMYSALRWLQFVQGGATHLRSALGHAADGKTPNWVTCNGLHDGGQYWDGTHPSSVILNTYDSAMAEEWMRSSTAAPTSWPSETLWRQNVDMLFDAAVTFGKPILICTKLWPTTVNATVAQSKQLFGFILASFLLGNANNKSCGRHFFHYRHDNAAYNQPVTIAGNGTTMTYTAVGWNPVTEGVAAGGSINIQGAGLAGYNGRKTVATATATTFTVSGATSGAAGGSPYVNWISGTDGDGSGTDMHGRHHWRPDVNFFGTHAANKNWFDRCNSLGFNITNVNYPTDKTASLLVTDTYVAQFANGYVLVNVQATPAAASRLTLPAAPTGMIWTGLDGTTYPAGAVPALAAHTGLVITAIPPTPATPGPPRTFKSWVLLLDSDTYTNAQLDAVLAHPGVYGVSFSQAWDTYETSVGVYSHTAIDAVRARTELAGKKLAFRVRAGKATPSFAKGRTWTVPAGSAGPASIIGAVLPAPCESNGTPNATFGTRLAALYADMSTYAVAHNIETFHGTTYGGPSAEAYEPDTLLTANGGPSGHTHATINAAYTDIITKLFAVDASLTVELSTGGFFSAGSSLQTTMINDFIADTAGGHPAYMQGNGWTDNTAPYQQHSWGYAYKRHGRQMLYNQPETGVGHAAEWDWTKVYDGLLNIDLPNPDYIEIYWGCWNTNVNKATLFSEALFYAPI